ncbi:MAG: hypothetical protein IKF77_00755 [Thermoguttaceae bacterium]|nr:hypothetical protein [Thermoguttaceae bacterium]MBR2583972.1 hypothetical protein [Thermoguttaceae bacterium]MBR3218427.1 hypothetical protein [Thermoguttaceae bacterium]
MTVFLPKLRAKCLCSVFAVLFCVVTAAAEEEPTRWWTWNGFKTEAALVSVSDDGGMVKLRKFNGKEVGISVSRLSGEDKEYVKGYIKRSRPADLPQEKQVSDDSAADDEADVEEEDSTVEEEQEGDEDNEDDYFDFKGQRLKKSEKISGIRLGDVVRNYMKGIWARDYEVKKYKDSNMVLLAAKNPNTPVSVIVLAFDKQTHRVSGFLVGMSENSGVKMSEIRESFSSKYEFDEISKEGDWRYHSKTEPKMIISAGYDDDLNVRVVYLHSGMLEAGGSSDEETQNQLVERLNL